jgi:hypothetical protein
VRLKIIFRDQTGLLTVFSRVPNVLQKTESMVPTAIRMSNVQQGISNVQGLDAEGAFNAMYGGSRQGRHEPLPRLEIPCWTLDIHQANGMIQISVVCRGNGISVFAEESASAPSCSPSWHGPCKGGKQNMAGDRRRP